MLFASRGGAYALIGAARRVQRVEATPTDSARCASVGTEHMAKDNPRARRLGEQIQRELTELLRRDVKDGRIGNVTITAVSVSLDFTAAPGSHLGVGKDGPGPKVQRGLEGA